MRYLATFDKLFICLSFCTKLSFGKLFPTKTQCGSSQALFWIPAFTWLGLLMGKEFRFIEQCIELSFRYSGPHVAPSVWLHFNNTSIKSALGIPFQWFEDSSSKRWSKITSCHRHSNAVLSAAKVHCYRCHTSSIRPAAMYCFFRNLVSPWA